MKPLFFVTCVPRCGSQWLMRLLDTASGVRCYHANYLVKNVVGGDIQFMIDSWKAKDPRQYLYESRKQIALLTEREAPGAKGWGEVNEFIRYYAPTVREVFGVPVVGLIRNGHLTIPSLLRHHFYDPNSDWEWTLAIEPQGFAKQIWPGTTPFERCCWLWANSYRRLLNQGVPIFTLESLNAEFGYVERLCEILRIDISYEDWQEHANKPVDDFYQGCPRPALPPAQLEMFNRWAGDIQEYFYG